MVTLPMLKQILDDAQERGRKRYADAAIKFVKAEALVCTPMFSVWRTFCIP